LGARVAVCDGQHGEDGSDQDRGSHAHGEAPDDAARFFGPSTLGTASLSPLRFNLRRAAVRRNGATVARCDARATP
jgi:hypothetical protein